MDTLYNILTPLWKNGNITERKYMHSHDEEGVEFEQHEDGGLTARLIFYEKNTGLGPAFMKYCRVLRLTKAQVDGAIMFVRAQNPGDDEERLRHRFHTEVGRSGMNSAEENANTWNHVLLAFAIAVVINAVIAIAAEKNHSDFMYYLDLFRIPISFALAGGLYYLARTPRRKRLRAQQFFVTGTAEEICTGLMEMEK